MIRWLYGIYSKVDTFDMLMHRASSIIVVCGTCMLDSELWEIKFYRLLSLVKEYIVVVWEIREPKL